MFILKSTMEATTVEDLLQDVDLTACLEQSPELEVKECVV